MSTEDRRGRVLVVDDDAMMRKMAAGTLQHAGFEVVEAADGANAVEAFECAEFNVVLLDVMMPCLDGYQVCRAIRAHPRGARVQILMLTGLKDTDSIDLAYRAGASDFITKPINWTLLSHRVRYALRAGQAIETELRTRESLERAQRMARLAHWQIDLPDLSVHASAALADVLGLASPASLPTRADSFLALVDEADRSRVDAARQAALAAAAPYQERYTVVCPDGTIRAVYEQAEPMLDGAGRVCALQGITQDVTDRVEAERRIRQMAHFDVLTALPNRQFFGELVRPTLERARRHGGQCALLHIDMDRFKTVNDALGMAGGDAMLRLLADRLQSGVRASDSAAAGAAADESTVARVGANAFTLLLSDIDSDAQAARVARRLLELIAEPIPVDGRDLVLTASMGIAMFPRDGDNMDSLARGAEQALYAAKAAGRNQHHFFNAAMHAAASAMLERESELRAAISDGQLRLHYQPKVDAASGRIVGAEALVRWMHPERGLVPPGEFIPLAEQSGLILPLTAWVLDAACADLRRRRDAGLPRVQVAVNLASPCFAGDGLLAQLDDLLERYQLEASSLVLEVTESMLMIDVDRAVERLVALHARGFMLSLDDFGTGYSSLSYLKRFPIDELKIDRSFITDVAAGGRDGALASSIISLARGFGLSVVAEGVETRAQLDFLLDNGCATHQGFLFARPMPAAEFDRLLRIGKVSLPSRSPVL